MENTIEVKKVELPFHQIAESISDFENGEKVNIFRCNLEELIYEKMFIMFEKYIPAVEELQTKKLDLQLATDKILLETDFKSLGLTNEKMRNAHIKPLVAGQEDAVDDWECKVRHYKAKLELINDLISARKLELKIETNLQKEE